MSPYNRKGALARLHCLARDLGIDNDLLRSIAATVLNQPVETFSLANCTNTQLSTLLDHFSHKATARGPQPVPDAASHRQVWKINQLAQQLGMDANRLEGFIERQTRRRVPPQQLRSFEASKVIEGLKKLVQSSANIP